MFDLLLDRDSGLDNLRYGLLTERAIRVELNRRLLIEREVGIKVNQRLLPKGCNRNA